MSASSQSSLLTHAAGNATGDTTPRATIDRLGRLPIEMKVAILASIPDLQTLRTVTLTIPGYYTAYKTRQRHVLFHVLSNGLSPEMLGEACSLHAAGLIKRDQADWETVVGKLIIAYEVDRTLGVSLGNQTVEVLREMALLHLTIEDITSKHAAWGILNHPNINENPYTTPLPLSPSELNRFHRAFYHYEMRCAVFGRTPLSPVKGTFDLRTMYFAQLGALVESFYDWEIEESACVRHYISTFYQGTLRRHASGLGVQLGESLYPACERVITATPFPRYLFQYEKMWLDDAANHCTGLGLSFLSKIMGAKSEQDQLELLKNKAWFSTMTSRTTTSRRDGTWPRLDENISWFLRHEDETYVYTGDDAGPNAGLGWARPPDYRIDSYARRYPNNKWNGWLLSWAYAMWDHERLDRWGILRSAHDGFHEMVAERMKKISEGIFT